MIKIYQYKIIEINNYRKQLNENILLFNKFHLSII